MKIVLQKYIADSGYCSRRRAEELIREKKVLLNGKIAELGARVGEEDEVKIGNKTIEMVKDKIYIKLNKPKGYTCTNKKFRNEKNIFELVDLKERLFVVGRLDKDSRGLVVLTNDGDWANKLMHPSFEHEKEYLIQLKIKNEKLKIDFIINKLLRGIDIGEGDGVVRAKEVEKINENTFRIILTQGKKRQIRRMFKCLGLEIFDLERIRINNIKLGKLKEGDSIIFNLNK